METKRLLKHGRKIYQAGESYELLERTSKGYRLLDASTNLEAITMQLLTIKFIRPEAKLKVVKKEYEAILNKEEWVLDHYCYNLKVKELLDANNCYYCPTCGKETDDFIETCK